MRTATGGGETGSGGVRGRRKSVCSVTGAADSLTLVIEVQREARPRAHIHQCQRTPVVGSHRGDRRQEVSAARRLAHLIPMSLGQGQQLVLMPEAEDLGGRNVVRAWGRSCARAVRV